MTTAEAPARQVVYRRPRLYPAQEAAIFCPERWGVIEASTKSGKTVGCICWLHEQAALGGAPGRNYWWVAPIKPQAKIAFERLKRFLPRGTYDANETDRTVTLLNGAVIWHKGAENPDSLYGEDCFAAVVDEATRVKAASWTAVRTTLTATGGPARIIGNVKGSKNWAFRLARKAEARMGEEGAPYHYAKLTVWDAVEAGIFSREEAEDARDQLTEAEFAELYLAEAADSDDQFFHTEKLGIVTEVPDGVRMARAWDFAVTPDSAGGDPDFTVGAKLAWDGRRIFVVDIVHRRGSPDEVVELVKTTARKDGRACDQVIEEEKGAAGKLLVSQFKQLLRGVDGTGRVFPSSVSGGKEARAFMLASRTNEGNVMLVAGPWNQTFTDEADDFPDGDHDDMVDAAAHAHNHLVPRTYRTGAVRVPGT